MQTGPLGDGSYSVYFAFLEYADMSYVSSPTAIRWFAMAVRDT
ncbi:MAG: hypothetical protein Fues2KO_09170 [Fuerstiella sp.]